jgi:hypothetical protein
MNQPSFSRGIPCPCEHRVQVNCCCRSRESRTNRCPDRYFDSKTTIVDDVVVDYCDRLRQTSTNSTTLAGQFPPFTRSVSWFKRLGSKQYSSLSPFQPVLRPEPHHYY